jgi:hypothetical protein
MRAATSGSRVSAPRIVFFSRSPPPFYQSISLSLSKMSAAAPYRGAKAADRGRWRPARGRWRRGDARATSGRRLALLAGFGGSRQEGIWGPEARAWRRTRSSTRREVGSSLAADTEEQRTGREVGAAAPWPGARRTGGGFSNFGEYCCC